MTPELTPTMTEAELRAAVVPTPKTQAELDAYIAALVDRQHDYGTCVYAMSMAATAAFYYVACKVGATGFQASCADMDVLRRTRHMEGPFMIVDGAQALFPQYELVHNVEKFVESIKPWLAEEAAKKLAANPVAHPNVLAHWQKLAEQTT
jgi:hypothetical protein